MKGLIIMIITNPITLDQIIDPNTQFRTFSTKYIRSTSFPIDSNQENVF